MVAPSEPWRALCPCCDLLRTCHRSLPRCRSGRAEPAVTPAGPQTVLAAAGCRRNRLPAAPSARLARGVADVARLAGAPSRLQPDHRRHGRRPLRYDPPPRRALPPAGGRSGGYGHFHRPRGPHPGLDRALAPAARALLAAGGGARRRPRPVGSASAESGNGTLVPQRPWNGSAGARSGGDPRRRVRPGARRGLPLVSPPFGAAPAGNVSPARGGPVPGAWPLPPAHDRLVAIRLAR